MITLIQINAINNKDHERHRNPSSTPCGGAGTEQKAGSGKVSF